MQVADLSTLRSLKERLEKAEEADRELDESIALAVQWPFPGWDSFSYHAKLHDYGTAWIAHAAWRAERTPAWTRSLEASLSLVREVLPVAWVRMDDWDDGDTVASILIKPTPSAPFAGGGPTLPLALLNALLSALISIKEREVVGMTTEHENAVSASDLAQIRDMASEGCLTAPPQMIGVSADTLYDMSDEIIRSRNESKDSKGWQTMENAPRTRPIVVQTEQGRIVKAKWVQLDDDNAGWGTPEEDDPHPKCWDDGFCWASNSDGEPSDPPVLWIEMPQPPTPR